MAMALSVLSYVNGLPGMEFSSIDEAASFYGIHRDTVVRLIITGEEISNRQLSICFDWSLDADEELTRQSEENLKERIRKNREIIREYRERLKQNATSKDL